MIDRLSTWLGNSLRTSKAADHPSARRRRARWPMDARLVRLSLACCAVGGGKLTTAQSPPPWNLRGILETSGSASSPGGTAYFRSDEYDKIPPGVTSVSIFSDSCWSYEWCPGGGCQPTSGGVLEFEIAPQSILVTFEGDLPQSPSGNVRFLVDLPAPVVVTWPGGSAEIDPAEPYGYFVDVPVTTGPAAFPIMFSGPFSLEGISTYMQVEVPDLRKWSCYQRNEAGNYWYLRDPFTGGVLSSQCEINQDDGLRCACPAEYGGMYGYQLGMLAMAELSGNRLDCDMSIAWACPHLMYGNVRFDWAIGIDRPIRLTWDYLSCGAYGGVFGSSCGGGGTLDLAPYDQGSYRQFTLISGFLEVMGATSGSDSFRIENLRFERIYPADVVADGVVNGQDISAILSKWGGPYDPHRTAADVNLDGRVGAEDLALVLFAWGTPG